MAIIGLLNCKEQNDAVFCFDAIERFVDQCHTVHVNLSINASKTKQMVLSFSSTYGFYDYLFINDSVIEKVESFKYLGTFFSNNLKWHANSDYVYGKLKQGFFAFS